MSPRVLESSAGIRGEVDGMMSYLIWVVETGSWSCRTTLRQVGKGDPEQAIGCSQILGQKMNHSVRNRHPFAGQHKVTEEGVDRADANFSISAPLLNTTLFCAASYQNCKRRATCAARGWLWSVERPKSALVRSDTGAVRFTRLNRLKTSPRT